MPLFSLSRRKSASSLPQNRAEDQETEGGRGRVNQHAGSGSRGKRSESATRVGGTRRPERDEPPALPPLPIKFANDARNAFLPQESFETSRKQGRQLPPGAMPPQRQSSMDQYSASSPPPPLPSKPPRRQSSFGATAFDSSQPRPLDSSHPSSLIHNPQYSCTPPRQSSRRGSVNPPLSNSGRFARTATSSESVDYAGARHDVVGIPPSSSFYAGSPHTGSVREASYQGLSSPFGSPQTSQDHSTGLGFRHSTSQANSTRNSSSFSPNRDASSFSPIPMNAGSSPPTPYTPSSSRLSYSTPSNRVPIHSASSSSSRRPPVAFYESPVAPHSRPTLAKNTPDPRSAPLERGSSTSEDEGVTTENTSVDTFTPPSLRHKFQAPPPATDNLQDTSQLVGALQESVLSAPLYAPLQTDSTPPRTAPPPSPFEETLSTRHLSSAAYEPLSTSLAADKRSSSIPPTGFFPPPISSRIEHPSQEPAISSSSQNFGPPTTPTRPSQREPSARLRTSETSRSPTASRNFDLSSPSRSPISPRQFDGQEAGTRRVKASPRAVALVAARERERKELGERKEMVIGVGNSAQDASNSRRASSEVREKVEIPKVRPRIEIAFSLYSRQILQLLLPFISYQDLVALHQTSRTIKHSLENDGRELILERFLGAQGYRAYVAQDPLPDNLITLTLRDLAAFRASQNLTHDDYSRYARAYHSGQLPPSKLLISRVTTRAWNRVCFRLRSQSLLSPGSFAIPAFPELRSVKNPVYKPPRAPQLRVWVPTAKGESWMNDTEIVECEREIWRSGRGAWANLRRGDIVVNVAIESFGNCGKTIFDGRFLRDFSFEHDPIGHLPKWLNMLSFSPSHFHNIIASSTVNPVFYLSLSPFVSKLQETLRLETEKVSIASPQRSQLITKHVYRGMIKVESGRILDSTGSDGEGAGGIEVVHPDWAGIVVLETEGTHEHASLLIARVASTAPSPWQIIREKCRPARLWIKPVLDR